MSLTFNDRLQQAATYLQWYLKVNCPKDTTNLSRNINIQYVEDGKARIVIGNENADYAVYTNVPWVSKKNGIMNPNTGWVEATIAQATPMIQQILSGEISQEEIDKEIGNYKFDYDFQVEVKLEEIDKELNRRKNESNTFNR